MPEAVAENRRRLVLRAGLPAEPAWLAQVHGITVVDLDRGLCVGAPRLVTAARRGTATAASTADAALAADAALTAGAALTDGAEAAAGVVSADAAFTRRQGRVCAILTADCLPVLLTDDAGGVVAAAHAGWRGLARGVVEATVGSLGAAPERLLAWLGPAIGPEHFEVGAEVRETLLNEDPGAGGAFVLNARGRFMADLASLVRRRLAALGVDRIYGGGACTHADAERYFSHRRDGLTGRQATLIWMDRVPR
jgi:YfiH family protein